MKKIGVFATFAISLLLCTNSFGQEQALAPAYQDGDLWQFRITNKDSVGSSSNTLEGDYSVNYSDGQFKFFELKAGQSVGAEVKGAQLSSMLGNQDSDRTLLQFPLSIGKTWRANYSYFDSRSRKVLVTSDNRVTGVEEVTIPAGTFRAFKVERYDTAGSNSRWSYTYFYSPQAKSIIKYYYESLGYGNKTEIELIKFGSAFQ